MGGVTGTFHSHSVRPEPVEGPFFLAAEKKGRASTSSARTVMCG